MEIQAKRRTVRGIALVLALSMVLIGAIPVFSWLADLAKNSIAMTAQVQKSYFESGDGTKEITTDSETGETITEGPYEIKYPIQLYYFTWLQWLGFFDDRQYYFYLSSDLDMTDYVIPPIGTATSPFCGVFDGNGHVISNLTVNDVKTAENYTDYPSDTDTAVDNPQIVGLFGVIGEYNGLPNAYTYDSAENQVKNFYLQDSIVETKAPKNDQALIGLVAGYVNGTLSGVGVIDCTIKVSSASIKVLDASNLSEGLSEYGIVGFCEEAYQSTLDVCTLSASELAQIKSQYIANSAGNAWGGSVDMYGTIQRLAGLRTQSNSNGTVPWSASWVQTEYHVVDNTGSNLGEDTYIYSNVAIGNDLTYVASAGYETGAYYYRNNAGNTSKEYKMHINGYGEASDKNAPYKTVNMITIDGKADAFLIQCDGYYLRYDADDDAFYGTADATQATKWSEDASHHFFTVTDPVLSTAADAVKDHDGNNIIGAVIGGYDTLYLNYAGDGLVIGNNASTVWALNSGDLSCTYDRRTYYVSYDSGNNEWIVDEKPYYVITDFNGNYLRATSATAVGTTTDLNAASHFTFSDEDNLQGKVSTTYNNATIYLRYNNNSLSFTNSSGNTGTTWQNDEDGLYIDATHRLYRGKTAWACGNPETTETLSTKQFVISDPNGNYMYIRVNGTNITLASTSDIKNATIWTSSGGSSAAPSGTISGKASNGTTYYIRRSSGNLQAGTSSTNWTNDDGKLYNKSGQTYYYIQCSGGTWKLVSGNQTTAKGNGTALTFTNTVPVTYPTGFGAYYGTEPMEVTLSGGYKQFLVTKSVTDDHHTGVVSYFPIATVHGDDNKTGYSTANDYADYYVSKSNTGYFVGGSYDLSNYNGLTSYGNTGNFVGDTRLGVYASSQLTTDCYQDGKIKRVKTIKSTSFNIGTLPTINLTTGVDTDGKSYDGFLSALSNFEKNMKQDSERLYGLHFVRGNININHVVTAPYVMINGKEYTDYELPENSVDFRLKEKGQIAFFAGTYVSGCNGFFSLHQIFRDDTEHPGKITAIREISKVYVNQNDPSKPVIYQYTDGSYSTGMASDPSFGVSMIGYSSVFDTAWIKYTQTLSGTKEIYYFEIPANEGEFALGSFNSSGANGAYLMYLDISTGKQTVDRIRTVEKFETVSYPVSYPLGVQFLASGSTYTSDLDSATFFLSAGKQDYSIIRTGNAINVTNAPSTAAYGLLGDGISTNVSQKTPDSTSTTTVTRVTDSDRNQTTGTTLLVTTTITETGGSDPPLFTSQVTLKANDSADPVDIATFHYFLPTGTKIKSSCSYLDKTLYFFLDCDAASGATVTLDALTSGYSFSVNNKTTIGTVNGTASVEKTTDSTVLAELVPAIPSAGSGTLLQYTYLQPEGHTVTSVFPVAALTYPSGKEPQNVSIPANQTEVSLSISTVTYSGISVTVSVEDGTTLIPITVRELQKSSKLTRFYTETENVTTVTVS